MQLRSRKLHLLLANLDSFRCCRKKSLGSADKPCSFRMISVDFVKYGTQYIFL